jgi:5-methylcytosine-specific restriction endonuclease McrA
VSLKTYVKPARHPAFTRFNVFLRDRFTCQYCTAREDLTFDHLMPRSKGGQTTWENVVTACAPCNLRKGGKLAREAKMAPFAARSGPRCSSCTRTAGMFPPNYLHDSWQDYLYWDAELEP